MRFSHVLVSISLAAATAMIVGYAVVQMPISQCSASSGFAH